MINLVDSRILLESAQSGNADSFGLLYGMYRRELYLYALKFLGNREDAEDAVQQASIKVYTGILNIKNPDAFKAYYFKALANTARSMLSGKSLRVVGNDEEIINTPSPEQTENTAIENVEINRALKLLSDDEREIVLLSTLGGFNSKEIAKITDYTAGSVRSKLSRALSKMREELKGE